LLVIRMDNVSYMDQTGIYALQEALTRMTASGLRVLVVGISVAHLDLLRTFQVVPHVVREQDVFRNFGDLKMTLPAIFSQLQPQGS